MRIPFSTECKIQFAFRHCRYRTLLRERAIWALQTTATATLCANPATLRMFLRHDPRSPAIGRWAINTEMDKVLDQLVGNMKVVLKRANKVALAAGEKRFYVTLHVTLQS